MNLDRFGFLRLVGVKGQIMVASDLRDLAKVSLNFTEVEVLASICRKSLEDFCRSFWDTIIPEKLVWNWHMSYICQILQRMAERVFAGKPKKYDLIINIAPGSTKSTLVSVMFPAWCWTRLPSCRTISGSYSHDLSVNLSRKSRDLVKSELYKQCFTDIEIREDQDTKGFFVNRHGGERYAFGIGGAVTGRHGHFVIVDDPLDPNRSVSEAELTSANRWMEETLPSRKIDRAIVPTILIMQRLHENDPTASRMRKADKQPVKHVCIPAEITEHVSPPSLRKHYVNGLMDPVRLPRVVLEEAMADSEFSFAAQYLQTPVPRGGAQFHTDKFSIERRKTAKFRRKIRAWDKAGTQGAGHYTVGLLMGEDKQGHLWILDVVRGRWDAARREKVILETARKDGYGVTIGIEQEPGSGGKESAQATVRRLRGYHIKVVKVGKNDGDKEARADPLASEVNAGNVRVLEAAWNAEFINEFRFFPRSRFKDQVDAASLAFNLLAKPRIAVGGIGAIKKMRGEEWKPKYDMPLRKRRSIFKNRSNLEKSRK